MTPAPFATEPRASGTRASPTAQGDPERTRSQAYAIRGLAHEIKGDLDGAIADFNGPSAAIHRQRRVLFPQRRLGGVFVPGNIYASRDQWDQAIADFTAVVRIDPGHIEAYNNRGVAYMRKGQYDKAIADCTVAIRLKPTLASAYGNRGLLQAIKGNLDEAIADFSTAIRLDPRAMNSYYNRSVAYRKKGQFEKAKADFAKAEELAARKAPWQSSFRCARGVVRLFPQQNLVMMEGLQGCFSKGSMRWPPGNPRIPPPLPWPHCRRSNLPPRRRGPAGSEARRNS